MAKSHLHEADPKKSTRTEIRPQPHALWSSPLSQDRQNLRCTPECDLFRVNTKGTLSRTDHLPRSCTSSIMDRILKSDAQDEMCVTKALKLMESICSSRG